MATAEPLGNRQVREGDRFGRNVVYEGELLRHSLYTRLVHWGVAVFFILALLSGVALFSPWLYKWLSLPFGGGPLARLLHPWFGLGFLVMMLLQLHGWYRSMRWSDNDRRWMKKVRAYVTNEDRTEADYVGKFNGGQKIWFWTMVGSGLVFLITGLFLWFPSGLGRPGAWISYFFHDLAALVMLGGFIIHIYEGTAAIPGTFHSMIRGTVREEWAWTHHPAWYREVTGRDAAADRAAAQQRQKTR